MIYVCDSENQEADKIRFLLFLFFFVQARLNPFNEVNVTAAFQIENGISDY